MHLEACTACKCIALWAFFMKHIALYFWSALCHYTILFVNYVLYYICIVHSLFKAKNTLLFEVSCVWLKLMPTLLFFILTGMTMLILKLTEAICNKGRLKTLSPHTLFILCAPQSTNRVATAAFWRTFHHDGKISPGWWGWGRHAHPLSLYLPSRTKVTVYAPAERADTFPVFHLYPICTLWCDHTKSK